MGEQDVSQYLVHWLKGISFWNISLAAIRGEVAKARRTIVTIQFGHNDMKIAPPESMGTNLTSMVQQIRAIGGEPVLVTSLTRRSFNANGTVADALGPWADGRSPRFDGVTLYLLLLSFYRNDSYCATAKDTSFGPSCIFYRLCKPPISH